MRKRTMLAVLVSLIAVLAMVALAGCGGGDKQAAIDAYKEAAANYTDEVQDLNFDATLTAKADMSDTEILSIDGAMKAQYKFPEGFSIKASDPKQIVDSLDKIDMLLELGGSMNAMGESAELAVDMYATDNKIYMHLVAPETDEVKSFFEITPDMKKEILDSLDEVMGQMEGSSSEDFAKLAEEFPIEKYVKSGSIEGNKVTLVLDLFKMLDDLVSKTAAEDGSDVTEALNSIQEMKKALSNGDIVIEATISDDKQFKSFKMSFDTEIDLGAAMGGGEDSAVAGDSKIHVNFVLDCPTYEVNTGKDVKFPSFDGYEDMTKEMTEGLESATEVVPDKTEADMAA